MFIYGILVTKYYNILNINVLKSRKIVTQLLHL